MAEQQFVLKRDLLMTLVEEFNNAPQEILTAPRLLLPWSEQGVLTFTEIKMTPSQLTGSPLVTGLGMDFDCFNPDQRERIASELVKKLHVLAILGCHDFVVSGEFVEQIAEPTGAEGYFRIDGDSFPLPRLQEYLSTVAPTLTWQWSSCPDDKELVQLFPVFCYKRAQGDTEVYSAPKEYFHTSSEGFPKGVVRLALH